jgi:hypothetical protein
MRHRQLDATVKIHGHCHSTLYVRYPLSQFFLYPTYLMANKWLLLVFVREKRLP